MLIAHHTLAKIAIEESIYFARLSSALVPSVEVLFETGSDRNAEIPPAENAEKFEKAVDGVRGDCPLSFFLSEEAQQKKKCSDRCGGKREKYVHGRASDSGLWIVSASHGEGHCW